MALEVCTRSVETRAGPSHKFGSLLPGKTVSSYKQLTKN